MLIKKVFIPIMSNSLYKGGQQIMIIKGMRIRCSVCKMTIHKEDAVFLDDIHTITHQRCYHLATHLEIKHVRTSTN